MIILLLINIRYSFMCKDHLHGFGVTQREGHPKHIPGFVA